MTTTVSRDEAVRMAGVVAFDRATRCATPYSLTAIPAGLSITQCTVRFTRTGPRPRLARAALWLDGDRRHTWLEVQPTGNARQHTANTTVDGLPVLHVQGQWLFVDARLSASLSGESEGELAISDDEARTLIGGFEPRGLPDDPTTW